jgi:molybdopterin/thiamine biosynthesis adenylyltransferase/rhodanese-related sulfurtransferase
MFNNEEIKRYNRHIILSEIGMEGQEKLKQAKVLAIGAGGLGCPILQYLAAAGVGTIGIVDDDKVDESNLQRQVLFTVQDIGKSKAETAKEKLLALNPHLKIEVYPFRLSSENALDIFGKYDIIVDGTDNFPTRYLVNDACVIADKPLVFGSIFKFEGQASVFNYENGPTYRCLYPEPPGPGEVPNCSEIGVLGVLPGLIGTIQANEVLKIILGIGEVLSGKLLTLDALSMTTHLLRFKAQESSKQITKLIDYEDFCGLSEPLIEGDAISVETLNEWLQQGKEVQVIDVREPHEFKICNIGADLIPMSSITEGIAKIATDKPVVVMCHHGSRSQSVINFLQEEGEFNNLINLTGGIHEWALRIDTGMATY